MDCLWQIMLFCGLVMMILGLIMAFMTDFCADDGRAIVDCSTLPHNTVCCDVEGGI